MKRKKHLKIVKKHYFNIVNFNYKNKHSYCSELQYITLKKQSKIFTYCSENQPNLKKIKN